MKHSPLLLAALAAILAGCTMADQNGTGGTLNLDPNAVVIPADQVDSATATDMNVQTEKELKTGQVVISDEGDGLVRRITGVTTTSVSQVGAQIVRKVYLKTEDAALEDAIASGDTSLDWGPLQVSQSSVVQSLPGVSVEALTGKITLANTTFTLPGGVGTMTLNGTIEQTLNPTFNLKFANRKVSLFEAGMAGSFKATLQATMKTSQKVPSGTSLEKPIVQFAPLRRAFLVGAVPVVVVVTPTVLGGVTAGTDSPITVNAGIAPTLAVNLGVRYDGAKWSALGNNPAFSASLNPTFSYTVPGGGQGQVYARMVLDVKFYGLAGPSLEAKPFVSLNLNPSDVALKGGLSASGKVEAGFKVLGKGMETAYAFPKTLDATQSYTCSGSKCTAN